MDRKDFLKYSGVALLGVVGLGGVATLLKTSGTQTTDRNIQQAQVKSSGFGSGKYGA